MESIINHQSSIINPFTGLGIIAPNGIGKDEFWQALISGKSGIDKITSFDASNLPCRIVREVNSEVFAQLSVVAGLSHRQFFSSKARIESWSTRKSNIVEINRNSPTPLAYGGM